MQEQIVNLPRPSSVRNEPSSSPLSPTLALASSHFHWCDTCGAVGSVWTLTSLRDAHISVPLCLLSPQTSRFDSLRKKMVMWCGKHLESLGWEMSTERYAKFYGPRTCRLLVNAVDRCVLLRYELVLCLMCVSWKGCKHVWYE